MNQKPIVIALHAAFGRCDSSPSAGWVKTWRQYPYHVLNVQWILA